MDVNTNYSSVNTTSTTATRNTNTTTNNATASNTATTTNEEKAYSYEASNETTTNKKNSYPVDQKELSKIMEETQRKSEQLINLANTLFGKQAEKNSISNLTGNDLEKAVVGLKKGLENGTIAVDAATIEKAKADVAEDGYYGVNQTSDRLVGFAKALSGGDPKKIEELRDGIIKGFDKAAKVWGDELPQISKDTFNATMDKLDSWANENGITLSKVDRM